MKSIMLKLWNDDAGIVALEYLLVATIVGLGLVVGLASLSEALNVELAELGNAILGLDTGYSIATQTSLTQTGVVKGRKIGTSVTHSVHSNHVSVDSTGQVVTSDNAFSQ